MEGWKETLWKMDQQPQQNLDEMFLQSTEAKRNDVGLINPSNGAGVLIRENRVIEMFADYGLGFRIDPIMQSFTIMAPTIKVFCNQKEEASWDEAITYFRGEYKDIQQLLEGDE
jgi:hypothetical protein